MSTCDLFMSTCDLLINKSHVNIIMLHVDITKSHVDIIVFKGGGGGKNYSHSTHVSTCRQNTQININ